MAVHVIYDHPDPNHERADEEPDYYLNSGSQKVYTSKGIDHALDNIEKKILQTNAHFIRNQSSLVVKRILSTHLEVAQFHPIGRGFKELPQFLASKQAIINVQNTDDKCFGYAILAALHHEDVGKNPDRPSKYEQYFNSNERGINNLRYPVALDDINEIEDKLLLRLNVFTFRDDEGRIREPLYVSEKGYPREVDLLFWNEHFAWIKDFSRFLYYITKTRNKKYFCKRCLNHFWKKHTLEIHSKVCSHECGEGRVFTMPREGEKLE